jgi:hypothetical protein
MRVKYSPPRLDRTRFTDAKGTLMMYVEVDALYLQSHGATARSATPVDAYFGASAVGDRYEGVQPSMIVRRATQSPPSNPAPRQLDESGPAIPGAKPGDAR